MVKTFLTNEDIPDLVDQVLDEIPGDKVFYSNLSSAVADINNGVMDNALAGIDSAKVAVGKADNGATTVTLLDDVTESVLIEVNKDIVLVLNGHTLSFNTIGAFLQFAQGTDCKVSGEVANSAIVKNIDNTDTTYGYVVKSYGKRLLIHGGRYSASGDIRRICAVFSDATYTEVLDAEISVTTTNKASNSNGVGIMVNTAREGFMKGCKVSVHGSSTADGIYLRNDSTCVIEDCDCSTVTVPDEAVTSGKAYAVIVLANATVKLTDSNIFADGPGDDAGETVSMGISNSGTVFCKNTNVTGTQCGVSNSGCLYVSGGTFTGYSHGGFYLSDCTTEGLQGAAYINDATIRCGSYTGEFTDIFAGDTVSILGGMYIGSGSNITAYLDGCSINDDNATDYGVIVRATSGETNNHLYISNSTIGGYCRVDSDAVELNLGHGVTLLAGIAHPDATYASYITYTNEVYRKHHPDEQLNGNDYGALVKTVKAEPKMELIHSVTVPEEGLAQINLTDLKLDAVTLAINSPATSTRGTAYLKVYYNGTNFAGSNANATDNANRAYSLTHDIWKRNGAWNELFSFQVTGWGIAPYTNLQGKVLLESDYPYIDRVLVTFSSMPAGATVAIYGAKHIG